MFVTGCASVQAHPLPFSGRAGKKKNYIVIYQKCAKSLGPSGRG
jgi:hypothetical protein